MLNANVIDKVEEFMVPYRKKEKILNMNAYNVKIVTGYGYQTIAEGLADAITDYEKANKLSEYEYNSTAEELLKWISYVNAYNALTDNTLESELKKYQNKCSELEAQHTNDQSTIRKLEHIVTELRTRIRIFVSINPELGKIGEEESEITDG